jgi:hypothetical protein
MGFGIMASVITNNVSALAALGNGLLPLRKIPRSASGRLSGKRFAPAEFRAENGYPPWPHVVYRECQAPAKPPCTGQSN